MADQPATKPLQEPPVSDELQFSIPLPPVSLQASGERKREFTVAVRRILGANFGFIVTSDIQLEITWMLHDRLRYEGDSAPDIDNILKPLLDGLCGPDGVIVDDNQVQHLSVGWIDWLSEQQQIDVRIRLNHGFWLPRMHLEFVQLEHAMCWPIDTSLPPKGQLIMIEGLRNMLAARDKLINELRADRSVAKVVLPQQRFFHVSRTTAFRRTTLADYLNRLSSLMPANEPSHGGREMTVGTFFRKFDLFANAPDAAEKMRGLILHFAVTGKLVPAHVGDVPIDHTYEDIVALVIDSPGDLPPLWRLVPLGRLGKWRGGGTPSKARADYWNGTVPWVSPKDMKTLSIDDAQDHISREAIESCSTKLLPSGTLLMVVRGMILVHTFPVAVTTREVTINQDMKALTPSNPAMTDFVLLTLRAIESRVLNAVERSSHGTCKLNTEVLEALPIPLPPLAEQKRIVAKVDELMALCDRLEAMQKERQAKHAVLARAALARFAEAPTPANLEYLFHNAYAIDPADLRKSILTMAFSGRLVPQNPNDEPASELLARARAEKARLINDGIIKKEPWAHKLDEARTLYDLPAGWKWTHVSDVVEKVTVGYVGSMKEQYVAEGVPFLRCQNVRENRFEPVGLTYISRKFHDSISKSTLKPGDVVVTRSGNVGVTCVIPATLPEANCSDLVIVKQPIALVPAFLSYFINSIAAGQIEAKTVGIALTHFNTQSVAQMTVALPPLAEQRRIVAKVDVLMALVDRLEAQLAESRALAGRLMEAVVAELTQPAAGTASADASPRIATPQSDAAAADANEPAASVESASPAIVETKAATTDLFGLPDQSEQYLRNGATVAALVIQRIGKGNGKTFVEKNLHLVESFCDVPMGRQPKRMERGPADLKRHDAIMDWAANADAFLSETSDKGQRVDYTRGEAFDAFIAAAGRVLGEKLASVEELIAKLRPLSSRKAEWIATAYGSWNDFIKDGIAAPRDEQIIKDIYSQWHVNKRDVPEKDWRWALNWLRDNNVIPSGKGPCVLPADDHRPLANT